MCTWSEVTRKTTTDPLMQALRAQRTDNHSRSLFLCIIRHYSVISKYCYSSHLVMIHTTIYSILQKPKYNNVSLFQYRADLSFTQLTPLASKQHQ